jgi:hypothetical protein
MKNKNETLHSRRGENLVKFINLITTNLLGQLTVYDMSFNVKMKTRCSKGIVKRKKEEKIGLQCYADIHHR